MLRRVGELQSLVVHAPGVASPSVAVVLLHGYGAPGDDLAPIASELLQTDAAIRENVRFYVPQALIGLEGLGLPDGRAWWPLDMNRLVLAAQLNRWEELRRETPPGLSDARAAVLKFTEAIRAETALPIGRIVLAGFSQGAMLCTDVALHLPESVAALCLASGSLISEEEWTSLAEQHAPLDVLMSHGRQDPILPCAGSEALRDLFVASGHQVEFLPFSGGHTIPWSFLSAFAKRLARLARVGVPEERREL
jgi:phospholipase/carboxylesterase